MGKEVANGQEWIYNILLMRFHSLVSTANGSINTTYSKIVSATSLHKHQVARICSQ